MYGELVTNFVRRSLNVRILTYVSLTSSFGMLLITVQECAEAVKADFGTIDILVHSLANGPEVRVLSAVHRLLIVLISF